jgi:hypothetical protein
MNNLPYYDVAEDANGRWFVMDENTFPISRMFHTQKEAEAELERIQDS